MDHSFIPFGVDYEEYYYSPEDNPVCMHCGVTDRDSVEVTLEHYLDLYFEKSVNNTVRPIGTKEWWNYKIQANQIVLTRENKEILLRGDTLGTYKCILISKFGRDLSYKKLASFKNLDLTLLKFCNCDKHWIYNDHTIGSFFFIPLPCYNQDRYNTLNIKRAQKPYLDNFFMFLKMIESYCLNQHVSDETIQVIFDKTKDYWNLYSGRQGYNNYITSHVLESFIKDIPDVLYQSPSTWDIETVNLYFKTLNSCIEKRNKELSTR